MLIEEEVERTPVLELACPDPQHLVAQAAHDLEPGLVGPVHGAVEALSAERLQVELAGCRAVEEAAELLLELVDHTAARR